MTGESVEWAPERPVYKHSEKDRFIFWNAHGLGWSIGKEEYLKSGSHWHRSKLDKALVDEITKSSWKINLLQVDWTHLSLGKVNGMVES